jgi:hypothetical protein
MYPLEDMLTNNIQAMNRKLMSSPWLRSKTSALMDSESNVRPCGRRQIIEHPYDRSMIPGVLPWRTIKIFIENHSSQSIMFCRLVL